MDDGQRGSGDGGVRVRYWAAARAAAGVAEESVPGSGVPLTDLVSHLVVDRPDLARVLSTCSVLIGDRPVGPSDRGSVVVPAGATVEFLPPFAGG